MKQQSIGGRLAAIFLALTLSISLLPQAALAGGPGLPDEGGAPPPTSGEAAPQTTGEADRVVPAPQTTGDADRVIPAPANGSMPGDGAVLDQWTQDPNTVKGTGSICAVEQGKLRLKAGSGNTNNGDQYPNSGPAVFISSVMTSQLTTSDSGMYTVTMDLTPQADGICFGVYVNYKNPNGGMFLGYNTPGGWFWQNYGGDGNYGDVAGPAPAIGEPLHLEITWSGDGNTVTFKANNQTLVTNHDYTSVVNGVGKINNIAIKLGKSNAGVLGEVLVSNLHYAGQPLVTTYDVSGTVTDGASPVAGANVTLGSRTAVTDDEGVYTVSGLPDGSYPLNVSKQGYWPPEEGTVEIAGSDVSGQDLTLTPYTYSGVTGTVTDAATGAPVAGATVAAVLQGESTAAASAVANAQGVYTFSQLLAGNYELSVTAEGYVDGSLSLSVPRGGAPVTAPAIPLTSTSAHTAILSTANMDVKVDLDFPRVISYTLKGADAGKILYGQTEPLTMVTLNGVNVAPTVEAAVDAGGAKVGYTMTAVDDSHHINCVIHAELVAEGKTLSFNINSIDNNLDDWTYPVERISIPNQSLVSIRSTQTDARLIGDTYAGSTISSGDHRYAASQLNSANNQRFFYAFVSGGGVSAGVSSNSEWGAGGAGSNNYRVLANAEQRTGYVSLGLSSSEWYYNRKVSSSDSNAGHNAPIAQKDKVMGPTELPLYIKVAVAGDENGDSQVDWQDAAIVARDTIIHKPYKSEEVPDLVTTRIAMNFGSQAQNPFLTTLDNAKRVYLNTDGLGQSILLKGYASEGHDSGHPDYANIGKRMGGVKDMNTMMEEGKKLGARFGIHVNASEFYPEAQAFSEKMVRRDSVGGPLHYGWNWLDQGVGINGLYDLASGNRLQRFADLKAEVGDNLDFVYVDVWGNGTSGAEDAWQTRKLSRMLTDNGWRVAHEWAYANDWDSTFQHWVSDYSYGSYSDKGQHNSEVERFLLNGSRDSFAPDFSHYGGSANAPLLGGCVTQGFEGWQGDSEYNESIESIFEHSLPTKFLQHYDVMKWTDNDQPVTLPYSQNAGDAPDPHRTSSWTPEVQITLQSKDRGDTVVVTRGSDETINDTYAYGTDAEKREYRSRCITLDGREILRGAPAPAAGWTSDIAELKALANQQYLLPWLWDTEGNPLPVNGQKLYHRNDVGGESTWELPAGWEGLANVKMYELTDNGRTNKVTVPVVNGQVTLNAKARVPYVVTPGDTSVPNPSVEWSTGLHLHDAGFNSANLTDNWTVTGAGDAARYVNQDGQSVLKMAGDVAVSQQLTDLTPGARYVTYVEVDNRSDAPASITVEANGGVLASNYTNKSIAKNYISAYSLSNSHPIEAGASNFQNMYVFFTAPASGTATLTLRRAAGEGNTYFDDVRTLETEADNETRDANGNLIRFTQDFEHVAQGEYPFVVGPVEGVADNRQHLSELHAPYTQAGWDAKKMDDVLDGSWSLKVNGLTQRDTLVYQTIPQNVRFEPGVTYSVSFDYQMGSPGTYELVYGSGPYNAITVSHVALDKSLGSTATCRFTLVGDPSGQTWFGIRSTTQGPDTQGTSGDAANFGGYKDFILDNLVIERSTAQKGELANLIAQADSMQQTDYDGDWAAFTGALATAKQVMNNQQATQAQIDAAKEALAAAMGGLTKRVVTLTGTVSRGGAPVAGAVVTLEDDSYRPLDSAVSGADGIYKFENVNVRNYKLKVSAPGYEVQTLSVTGLTAGQTATQNASLTAQAAAPYVNTFDGGDVSMLRPMAQGDPGSAQAVLQNGSGAAKISFASGSREINNIVDKTIQMKNGTVSCDVTMLGGSGRFGFTLRGASSSNRVFLGLFDGASNWGWEYWGPNGSSYSGSHSGPALTDGVTRHLEATLDGNHVTLKVDGVTVINENMAGTPPDGAGYIGFNSSWARDVIVDNLRVTPADAPAAGSHTIQGTVRDADGAPIAGANVAIRSGDTVITRTTAGLDGSYTTMAVPAGSYQAEASAPGYAGVGVPVTVADADATGVDLTLTLDVSGLRELYNTYKDAAQGHYTDASWAALQAALETARIALASPTADRVASAYAGLQAAIGALTEKPVDKSLLRTYYNSYRGYRPDGYTADSWANFQSAIQAAGEVLNNFDARQSEVDAACEALIHAEQALTRVGGGGSGGSGGGFVSSPSSEVQESYTLPQSGGATVYRSDLQALADSGKSLTLKGDQAVVKLDAAALKAVLAASGGSATFQAAPAELSGLAGAREAIGSRPAVKLTVTSGGKAITDFSPGRVTVELKYAPAAAETADSLCAVYVDAAGQAWPLADSLYDAKQGAVAFSTSHFSVFGVGLRAPVPVFTDTANHWAKDAIDFAAARGLLDGAGKTAFRPDDAITRGELAMALGRLAGIDINGYRYSVFPDVKSDAAYAPYVTWAAKQGVMGGVSKTAFAPEQTVTRQELAVILDNYCRNAGGVLPSVREAVRFPDDAALSAEARDAVKRMQTAGVLMGKSGGSFDPAGPATRAQASEALRRLVERSLLPDSGAAGWDQNDSGQFLYYDKGKPVTGVKTIDGTAYTFDQNGVTAAGPKKQPAGTAAYTVKPGDSFWRIAHSLGCDMNELARVNSKSLSGLLLPGETLRIP